MLKLNFRKNCAQHMLYYVTKIYKLRVKRFSTSSNIKRITMKISQCRTSAVLHKMIRLATIGFTFQRTGKRTLPLSSDFHRLF